MHGFCPQKIQLPVGHPQGTPIPRAKVDLKRCDVAVAHASTGQTPRVGKGRVPRMPRMPRTTRRLRV